MRGIVVQRALERLGASEGLGLFAVFLVVAVVLGAADYGYMRSRMR